MKKLLALIVLLLTPLVSHGAVTATWQAASTAAGLITPNRINGAEQTVQAKNFTASSTTATSTFEGSINIKSGLMWTGSSIVAIGDSFTAGTGASSESNRYINRLASTTNWTLSNLALSGKQTADMAATVYAQNPVATSSYVYYLGINDMRNYSNVNQQPIFQSGHLAELAYLSIASSTNKVAGNQTVKVGSWSNGCIYVIDSCSTTNGNTASTTVYGKNVLVAYGAKTSNAGTFTITVDGTSYGTFNNFYSGSITTGHGVGSTTALAVIPNLANGWHTVVLTVTSATSAANEVSVDWIAGSGSASGPAGPKVYTANIPRMTAAGYSTFGGSDARVEIYNRIIDSNVSYLASIGLNVVSADVASTMNLDTDYDADGLHPNNAGHLKISTAFFRVVNAVSTPQEAQLANIQDALIVNDQKKIHMFSFDSNYTKTEAVTVDGNKVGIGDTAPIYPLKVKQASGGGYQPTVEIENTTTANYTMYGMKGDGRTWGVGVGNSTNSLNVQSKWFVFDNNAVAMRFVIDTNGNGGMGSTSPGTLFSIGTTNGINLSNTGTSTFPLALRSSCFTLDGLTCISSGTGYPFAGAGNSTSTLTQFNGGLTSYASTTIGDGTVPGGLTVSGNSTTTGQQKATSFVATGVPTMPLGTNGVYMGMTNSTNGEITALQTGIDYRSLTMNAKTLTLKTWNGSSLVTGYFQDAIGRAGFGASTTLSEIVNVQGNALVSGTTTTTTLCLYGDSCRSTWPATSAITEKWATSTDSRYIQPNSALGIIVTNSTTTNATTTKSYATSAEALTASSTSFTLKGNVVSSKLDDAFLLASSTMGTGTTTLKVSGGSQAMSILKFGCTSAGSGTFVAHFGDSTASSTSVVSSTNLTTTFTTISSNNAFTAGETLWFSLGSVSGTVVNPTCSWQKVVTTAD